MPRQIRTWGPPLLLISPTLILLGVFVYGLIAVEREHVDAGQPQRGAGERQGARQLRRLRELHRRCSAVRGRSSTR